MAELVDACVSGAHAARCAGSSPVLGTAQSDVPLFIRDPANFNLWEERRP